MLCLSKPQASSGWILDKWNSLNMWDTKNKSSRQMNRCCSSAAVFMNFCCAIHKCPSNMVIHYDKTKQLLPAVSRAWHCSLQQHINCWIWNWKVWFIKMRVEIKNKPLLVQKSGQDTDCQTDSQLLHNWNICAQWFRQNSRLLCKQNNERTGRYETLCIPALLCLPAAPVSLSWSRPSRGR